uniref:Secreted protein n=1 Tax=Aegilops tauschii subsp. strangulata TaxID=200361 RepID=A0A453LQI3_AEGTS
MKRPLHLLASFVIWNMVWSNFALQSITPQRPSHKSSQPPQRQQSRRLSLLSRHSPSSLRISAESCVSYHLSVEM